MKIELDIKRIKSNAIKTQVPLCANFNIANTVQIRTDFAKPDDGIYTFMQKNTVYISENDDINYIEISLIQESGNVAAHITVFFNKFKQFQNIILKEDKKDSKQIVNYNLYYSCKEIISFDETPQKLKRRNTLNDEPQQLKQQSGKLEILKLGILVFNFSQRLDPVVYLYNQFIQIMTWKKPLNTLTLGFILTFIIYNLKISIFIGSVILVFCRKMLFKKLSKIHKYKNIHKRLVVPQQNAYFIQYGLEKYCQLYQYLSQFLFNDDKGLIIEAIQLMCKMGVATIILLFIFGVQNLVVISLWCLLIATSPLRNNIFEHIKPMIAYLLGQLSKIQQKVTYGITTVMKSNINIKTNRTSQKQYYFYQYERWWVIKQWTDSQKKFSDQNYQSIIIPRAEAPKDYVWVEQWKIDLTEGDEYGYQYSNDFTKQYLVNLTIATVRRRKWKRKCVKVDNNYEQ